MNTKSGFILTGGSGILGTELQKESHTGFRNIEYWAPTSAQLDIVNCSSHWCSWLNNNYEKLMSMNLVGLVHCAAYTDVPKSETPEGKKQAVRLNILGTENIKDIAFALGIPMIYISTDYVYSGETGNYSENDKAKPVNYYAMTKLMGEALMGPSDYVIRTSFKPDDKWPFSKAFDDLYTSADYVDIIAEKISDLLVNLTSFYPGVYNIGTERKSIYELARKRTSDVKPMSRKEIKDVELPFDVSLNTEKYDQAYETIIV